MIFRSLPENTIKGARCMSNLSKHNFAHGGGPEMGLK